MSTTHRHVSQPTRRSVEWRATQEQRKVSGTSLRCWWEKGDPCSVTERCRCGAHRTTAAIWDGTKAVPAAPMGAWVR